MTTPFSGSNSEHWYIEETEHGITPDNPAWIRIRSTGGFPVLSKDTIISNELTGDREISAIRSGANNIGGEFSVELSHQSQDDLIAGAQTSSWVAGFTVAGIDITVDASLKTFTRATGDFIAEGVEVNDLIRFDGLTGNNATPFIVTDVTALTVTGSAITKTLEAETATTGYSVASKVGTGSECKSFSILTILKGKCGGSDFMLITRGVEFTGFTFEVAVNASVTGTIPFIGRSQEVIDTLPAGSTFNAVSLSKPYAGIDGKIIGAGQLLALFTSATIQNDNAASAQFELGSNGVSFIERGNTTNTISVSAFMHDKLMIDRFINETETSFNVVLIGLDGAMAFSLPKTFITSVAPSIDGQTSVTQTIEATATGSSEQSSIIIQRLTY